MGLPSSYAVELRKAREKFLAFWLLFFYFHSCRESAFLYMANNHRLKKLTNEENLSARSNSCPLPAWDYGPVDPAPAPREA